ncbi:MAG TPA: putative metal-binding motif-containing protein [Microthrixaceae bacterium]|nr:putative metal-binding motif-containing protein [Microthrixaceae bacterium]
MSQKLSYFGSSSGGHDVNGDGLDDIVQCEVDFDGHLFLGTLGGKPVESRAYHGTMPGGEKCYDAENADVNGDGYGDVVFSDLGLSQAQAGHPNSYGWIYVYPGGPGFATATPLPMPAFPGKRNQGFGATLAKADFNGDGYEDIASVGVGCASPYLRGDSDAWIFLGGPTGLSSAVWSWRAHVPGPGCELVQVEASPDINGDGFDELLLWGEQGAWWVPGSATGAGDPVAFPHRTHVDTGYPFYYKANAAGDINADGYGDLLLLDADGVHVHLGGPDGPQENVWGVPTWNGRVLGAFSSLDWWAFGPLGDVNGDGYGDFGVGNRDVNTEPGDGIALLFFGRPEPDIDLDGVPNALDCQPYRWWSNQYAPELPGNAYDDDCDGTFTCFLDLDGDGYGGATSLITLPFDGGSCADAGYLDAGPDCHDDDPALGPQTPDVPDDDVDQDCDGWLACHLDLDDDGWGALYVTDEVPAGASCQADPAFLLDDRDCDDTLASTYPGAPDEPANHHDDDCDGDVACWVDADLDGYGDPTTSIESPDLSCQHPGMSGDPDCDDTRFAVHPNRSEVVGNGLDDNCDGWYGCFDDLDGDGYGVPWAGGRARQDAQTPDCAVPNRSATSDDCDDARPDVHPGALERPYDVDLIDADCDGWELCYPGDLDGDRYAPPGAPAPVLVQSGAWVCPLGYGGWTTDCAEGDPTISPGTPEVSSNGVDEDCDGLFACSPDVDGDGYTSASRHLDQATPCRLQLPSTDCDDEDPTVYPGVAEQINDHDDDCDGLAICVDDLDYDDFPGTPVTVSLAMGQVCEDVDLYGELTDCDDHLSRIRPTGAEDPFTARDENCDGLPGSNLQATWLDATTLQLQAVGSPQGATVVLLGSMTGPGGGPCARALRGQCAGLLSPFVVQPTRTPNDANKATWTLHVPRAAAGRTAWWQVWNLRPTEVLGTPVVAVTVP